MKTKSGKIGTDTTIINMKYLEELNIGECFNSDNNNFIITTDFKKNGQRLCVNLSTGFTKWIDNDLMINSIDIFTFDKDNNIIAMRERKKEDVSDQT